MLNHIFNFILPLFFSNMLHMFIVKANLFFAIAKPVSTRYFGTSKTIRGFIILSVSCGLFYILFNPIDLAKGFCIGSLLGFCYALAELPNSFIKRKLGIKSGEISKKHRAIQLFIDKTDSLLLLAIVYYLITDISLSDLALLCLIALGTHVSFSYLFYKLKWKAGF